MAVKVYQNKSGSNITWEADNGVHMSWHSNSNSNGKPLFSVKVDGCGQYVKNYDENGRVVSEVLKDPKK